MGYVPLGTAFGLLAVSQGIPWYYTIFMSIFMYAGAGQFLAVALFSVYASYIEIAVAIFLLNLRHFFYGLSFINDFKQIKGFARKYCIFGLTDETFAILKTSDFKSNEKEKIYTTITALNQSYWVFGTIIGAFLGSNISLNYKGIEFSLTALFVVLGIEFYKKNRLKKPLMLSLIISLVGMIVLPSSSMLVISLLVCAIAIFLFKDWIENER